MRPKKTTGRGLGIGVLVEELPTLEQCEKATGDASLGEGLLDAIARYAARKEASAAPTAEVKATLEALKYGRVKPEQLHDVDPITEGLLRKVSYATGQKDLALRPLEHWTADELADAALRAFKLIATESGRPDDEAMTQLYVDLLKLRSEKDFVRAALLLAGEPGDVSDYYIEKAIERSEQLKTKRALNDAVDQATDRFGLGYQLNKK